MTNAQIWAQVNNDPNFAINFIIDNNPAAVESNITGEGISLPANPSNAQIRGEIDALMNQIKDGIDNNIGSVCCPPDLSAHLFVLI